MEKYDKIKTLQGEKMKRILVIVDMVNGFVNEGALADKKINAITPNIVDLIQMGEFDDIIAFRDCHQKDDKEFKVYPPHCLAGTRESEMIEELKPYQNDFIDMPKRTTNGFICDSFKKYWQNVKNEQCEYVVTGCCTDICVKDFCDSLISGIAKSGNFSNVIVLKDCVATFDSPVHNAKEMRSKTFELLQERGAVVFSHQKYLDTLNYENE